jgi:hypothetical protein
VSSSSSALLLLLLVGPSTTGQTQAPHVASNSMSGKVPHQVCSL